MMAGSDDAALIRAARSDRASFGALFDRHFATVYRFCERRVGRDLAEDLAGETLLVTLRVNATTYLPIQSTATGHATEHTVFTWLPATASSRAMLDVTVPRGFRRVAPPPTHVQVIP